MAEIRIDQLPSTVIPSVTHVVPAMNAGLTVKLTIQQIIDLAKSQIVDSAPEALNTLDELSSALNDDANFATNVLASIAANQTSISENAPAGKISFFARSTAPAGWLKCNGAAISRTSYSELFSALSTFWGSGDGSTTFNVPDLRGWFLRVWDDGANVDAGRSFGSQQQDAFQGHHHYLSGNLGISGSSNLRNQLTQKTNDVVDNHYVDVSDAASDGTNGTPRTASETRPKNISLLACVKY